MILAVGIGDGGTALVLIEEGETVGVGVTRGAIVGIGDGGIDLVTLGLGEGDTTGVGAIIGEFVTVGVGVTFGGETCANGVEVVGMLCVQAVNESELIPSINLKYLTRGNWKVVILLIISEQ
jgi:hypothetical protein